MEPDYSSLTSEMYQWLATLPQESDVDAYVRSLDPTNLQIIVQVQEKCVEQLFWEKKSYYQKNNIDSLIDILLPNVELTFLSYAGEYNIASVQQKYSKEFPALVGLNFPMGFATWAKWYCEMWYSLSLFQAYPEFIQQDVLLHSVQEMSMNHEQLTVLIDELQKEIKIDQSRSVDGREMSLSEQDQLASILSKFSFLTRSYIQELIKPYLLEKKRILMTRLLNVMVILTLHEEGIESTEVLREQLRLTEEEAMLQIFNDFRVESRDNSQYITYLNQVMPQLWNSKNILTGQTFQILKSYVSTLAPGQRQQFILSLYASMRQATDIVINLDPIDPKYVIQRVSAMQTESDLPAFITEMLELVEEPAQVALAQATMKLFYDITHTYPEPA